MFKLKFGLFCKKICFCIAFLFLINIHFVFANVTNKILISNKDKLNDEYISGSHLEIRDNNNNLITAFVSIDEPFVIEKKLKVGKYYLIESKPSSGYMKNKDKITFEIDNDDKVKEIVIYSTNNNDIKVPSTGTHKKIIFYITGFILIITGVYCLYENNKKNI